MVDYRHPEALASTAWLADHLDDPSVRVVDARFDLRVTSAGTVAAVPGRDAHGEGHIPGAVFVDVMSDLADPEDPLVILSPPRFEALMGRLGISEATTVVVYDDRGGTWAARLWWALRYYGHDAVKLLDGGLTRWEAEDRSIERQAPEVLPATFRARVRPELSVGADEVMQAIGRADDCIVDALPEAFFTGEACLYPTHRAGHIPTARNGLVKDHFEKLGFARICAEPNGETVWRLDVHQYSDKELPMKIEASASTGSASAA